MQNPTYFYQNGTVFLKFTKVEEGVIVYLTAGSDYKNATVVMEEKNRTIVIGKVYEIDQSLNYIITAIPKKNSFNTSVSFEYFTDGEEYPFFELYYNQWFTKNPNG